MVNLLLLIVGPNSAQHLGLVPSILANGHSSILYSYQVYFLLCNVFQHPLLWLVVLRMQPQPDMLGLTVTVAVGESLGFSLGVEMLHMIEASHPLHTHRRSL